MPSSLFWQPTVKGVSPSVRRKPSSTIECKWGNGDRAISPLRETREAGGRANYNTESLVPFDLP